MKALNPFLLLVAATAFCVSARGVLGRSLSTEPQSTTMANTFVPTPTPTSSTGFISTIPPSATISELAIMPRDGGEYTTNYPLIYTTTVPSPNNPSTSEVHRIVPFDIQIWESCHFKGGEHVVTLVYTNGGKAKQHLPLLKPGGVVNVDMQIPGFNPLKFGPFNSNSGMLKVEYEGSQISDTQCEANNQALKIVDTCVYCVPGKWDGGPVDCNKNGSWRYKKMYCEWYAGEEKPA